jgi:succinate dehydrogenase hydrophobic anchor subunit
MVRDSGVIIQYLTAVVLLLLCRVTSGLVIVAKNKKTAALISKEIRENSTQKVTFQSMLLY